MRCEVPDNKIAYLGDQPSGVINFLTGLSQQALIIAL